MGDYSEAVNLALGAWMIARDETPWESERIEAAVRAAAPIIGAGKAEVIAAAIEAESDRRENPRGTSWASDTSTHRKAGWHAGMETAARIARGQA